MFIDNMSIQFSHLITGYPILINKLKWGYPIFPWIIPFSVLIPLRHIFPPSLSWEWGVHKASQRCSSAAAAPGLQKWWTERTSCSKITFPTEWKMFQSTKKYFMMIWYDMMMILYDMIWYDYVLNMYGWDMVRNFNVFNGWCIWPDVWLIYVNIWLIHL